MSLPTANSQQPTAISILGVPIHDVTTDETLTLIDQFVREECTASNLHGQS